MISGNKADNSSNKLEESLKQLKKDYSEKANSITKQKKFLQLIATTKKKLQEYLSQENSKIQADAVRMMQTLQENEEVLLNDPKPTLERNQLFKYLTPEIRAQVNLLLTLPLQNELTIMQLQGASDEQIANKKREYTNRKDRMLMQLAFEAKKKQEEQSKKNAKKTKKEKQKPVEASSASLKSLEVTSDDCIKIQEATSTYTLLVERIFRLKDSGQTKQQIDAELKDVVSSIRERLDYALAQDDLEIKIPAPRSTIFTPNKEVSALKQIYNNLYSDNTDKPFWEYIQVGFTGKKGQLFLSELKKQGVYQMLFPCLNPENKEQNEKNEKWFEDYIEYINLNANDENTGFLTSPFKADLQALLIAKELGSSPSDEDIRKVHAAYKISTPCDEFLQVRVRFINDRKNEILNSPNICSVEDDQVKTVRVHF